MKRFRMFFRFDREERWLEEMAGNGWLLSGKGLFYEFQRCTPGECVIRTDYREFKNKGEFWEYVALFEDSGWKHLAGSKGSGNQYFLRLSDSGTEDIFSDAGSRAGRYKRLAEAWMTMGVVFSPYCVIFKGTVAGAMGAMALMYLAIGAWYWWKYRKELK